MHLCLLFLGLLELSLSVSANTEIINFQARYQENVTVPQASGWPVLSHANPVHIYSVQPARLQTPLDKVCEPPADPSCPHEVWATLDLDDEQWRAFSKFTLRISWPASYPADFTIQTFSPSELRLRLHGHDGSPAHPHDASTKIRRQYARVRLVDTGVRSPSSSAPVAPAVPFALRLEPLYLGVIPASVVPVLLFLVPMIVFASVVVVPRIQRYMASVAKVAKEELSRAQKEEKMD